MECDKERDSYREVDAAGGDKESGRPRRGGDKEVDAAIAKEEK